MNGTICRIPYSPNTQYEVSAQIKRPRNTLKFSIISTKRCCPVRPAAIAALQCQSLHKAHSIVHKLVTCNIQASFEQLYLSCWEIQPVPMPWSSLKWKTKYDEKGKYDLLKQEITWALKMGCFICTRYWGARVQLGSTDGRRLTLLTTAKQKAKEKRTFSASHMKKDQQIWSSWQKTAAPENSWESSNWETHSD